MKIEYISVNANKLHDELIESGINPLLVESLEDKTWITFEENTDMKLVQQLIDSHDPTPLPQPPTDKERLQVLEQAMLEMIMGGM